MGSGASTIASKDDLTAAWVKTHEFDLLKKETGKDSAEEVVEALKAMETDKLDGVKKSLTQTRYNTLRESPADAKYKLAVVQFKVPGATNGGSDKGPDGNRIDSIPIANGVIAAGGACDLVLFDSDKNKTDVEEFAALTSKYDALIVRINPGQLSQGTEPGTQERFDALMNKYISEGKLIWSSPKIQTQMGAKDALVKIGKLGCGLPDTLAYYDAEALEKGFKACCAYQPRVIKQNRGSAGEGIWLCWLAKKEDNSLVPFTEYPAKSLKASEDGLSVETDASLKDDDWLKLMEMNDNHVEYHTVKEFLAFCVKGPDDAEAKTSGEWKSTFPGRYLEGGKAAGGQLVDQRLLPRISEGEVRILMAGDTCQMAVHKKPTGGGLSAVGGNSDYTYYKPEDAKYKDMVDTLYTDIPTFLPALGLSGEPLPLLWTADYIPKNPEGWEKEENASDAETKYVVGEFNCSCVGISKFQAVCGGEETLADVSDEDYFDACELTNLMGVKAIEMLEKASAASKPAESKPAESGDPLSAALKEAKAAFDALDKDSSGEVSFKEFITQWNVPELFKGFEFAEAAGDDDMLTYGEFFSGLVMQGKIPEESVQDLLKEVVAEKDKGVMKKQLDEIETVFKELGGDDGIVTLSEFFMKSSGSKLLKGFDFAKAAGEDKKMTFAEMKEYLQSKGVISSAL